MPPLRKNGEHYMRPVWRAMLARCENPKNKRWARYGGRGITVCERWHTFENWLADMGDRPSPHHSIDRIDNDGPYCPGNCRWATRMEQRYNREDCWVVEFDGRQQSQAQWERELGLYPTAIANRAERGWGLEEALLRPAKPNPPRLLTHAGETLPLAEWSRRTGIPQGTIDGRLMRGWSVDRALTEAKTEPLLIEWRGVRRTIREWAIQTGIGRSLIANRLKAGWSIERALSEPVREDWGGRKPKPRTQVSRPSQS